MYVIMAKLDDGSDLLKFVGTTNNILEIQQIKDTFAQSYPELEVFVFQTALLG